MNLTRSDVSRWAMSSCTSVPNRTGEFKRKLALPLKRWIACGGAVAGVPKENGVDGAKTLMRARMSHYQGAYASPPRCMFLPRHTVTGFVGKCSPLMRLRVPKKTAKKSRLHLLAGFFDIRVCADHFGSDITIGPGVRSRAGSLGSVYASCSTARCAGI